MFEPAAIVIFYLVFCVLTGLCALHRRIGFFGAFFASLIVTPLVTLTILMVTAPSQRAER